VSGYELEVVGALVVDDRVDGVRGKHADPPESFSIYTSRRIDPPVSAVVK
jgi:hypothetical protein